MTSERSRTATPERLAWVREQLAGRLTDDPVAGEIFRPRGAWGDRSMRGRRFLFRRLGVGGGLHELERRMGVLNLAVATESRLLLLRLRGSWRGLDVAGEIAEWPLRGLAVTYEHRQVEAEHFGPAAGNTFSTSSHTSRIVVLRIELPREAALEIDLARSRDALALIDALEARSRRGATA